MRIVANSAVPWLGRRHVPTERSNNSAVCAAHVGALLIAKTIMALWGVSPCSLVEIRLVSE